MKIERGPAVVSGPSGFPFITGIGAERICPYAQGSASDFETEFRINGTVTLLEN